MLIEDILKDNWVDYKVDLFPKERRMKVIKERRVDGMSSENIRFLINELVRLFAPKGVYFEVGIYRGCSLLSAALFNPKTRCIGIDDFSQFDNYAIEFNDRRKNEQVLRKNLRRFGNPKNIEWHIRITRGRSRKYLPRNQT